MTSKIGSGSDEGRIGSLNPMASGDAQERSIPEEASTAPGQESQPESVQDAVAELDSLIGLEDVKHQVRRLIASHRANTVRQEHGRTTVPVGLHLAFLGPPGTGKTSVARLIARIYRALGLLPRGHLVEADRSSLVAGYVGQTALKVQEAVRAADGGVLFVDEAYALASDSGGGFGDEAIATLINEMENRRTSMAVIIAGYDDAIKGLLATNPGMKSRFQTSLTFPDYSQEELLQIFTNLCSAHAVDLTPAVTAAVQEHLIQAPTAGQGGNARYVRNLFEAMFMHMSHRANEDDDVQLHEVTAFDVADIPPAAQMNSSFGFLGR